MASIELDGFLSPDIDYQYQYPKPICRHRQRMRGGISPHDASVWPRYRDADAVGCHGRITVDTLHS
jgi:hypothetical protein